MIPYKDTRIQLGKRDIVLDNVGTLLSYLQLRGITETATIPPTVALSML